VKASIGFDNCRFTVYDSRITLHEIDIWKVKCLAGIRGYRDVCISGSCSRHSKHCQKQPSHHDIPLLFLQCGSRVWPDLLCAAKYSPTDNGAKRNYRWAQIVFLGFKQN
jgi:hypothetical protein